MEILRDPVRLAFAFVGSVVLMLAFGFGITTDVENIRLRRAWISIRLRRAGLPRRVRGFARTFSSGHRFIRPIGKWNSGSGQRHLAGDRDADPFGRDLRRGRRPGGLRRGRRRQPVSRRDHQAIRHQGECSFFATRNPNDIGGSHSGPNSADIQVRYLYNPSFESIYAIVPSIPPILLILIPAILMAVSVVREKELGSIINFYVTPTTRLEFLLGKQLPVHRDRDDQLRDLDAHGDRRFPGAAQGQRPDADALCIACT